MASTAGDAIACKSSTTQLTGHRDGIYFEFVTDSIIWRNLSTKNLTLWLAFYVFSQ